MRSAKRIVLSAVATLAGFSPTWGNTLGPATVTGELSVSLQGVGYFPQNPNTPGSYSTDHSSGGSNGQGNVTISPTPTPTISGAVSGSWLGPNSPNLTSYSTTQYSYQMMVTGPQPSVLMNIVSASELNIGPIDSSAQVLLASSALNIQNSTQTFGGTLSQSSSFQYNGFAKTITATPDWSGSVGSGFSGGFGGATSVNFLTDTLYTITLQLILQVSLGMAVPGSAQVTGFIDPYMFIDPSVIDANLYNITFSPTIGNSPIAETPVPAALPLFATGLGLLGWLAHRRKRKAGDTTHTEAGPA